MSALETLLSIQEHDTRLDQLAHRRATLPERDAVEANAKARAAVEAASRPLRARRDELGREQKRLEDEAASVEAHAAEIHAKLYGGTVTAIRELQAFQDDHDALKRRQSDLEDQVLEVMEQIEPVDDELRALAEQLSALESEAGRVGADLASAEATVDAEVEVVTAAREALVPEVPADLLADYERLRRELGGVGIAKLVGANCMGCHLSLPSMELDRIRGLAADSLVHCEDCGRILVH